MGRNPRSDVRARKTASTSVRHADVRHNGLASPSRIWVRRLVTPGVTVTVPRHGAHNRGGGGNDLDDPMFHGGGGDAPIPDDNAARRAGTSGKGTPPNLQTGSTLRKTVVKETVTVESCAVCGTDLSDIDPIDRESRVLLDIVLETVEHRIEAEVKDCPGGRA